jgi:CRISPR/Cas system CSM-associated protein Csm3 (group 7 of RAMP superfamily)
MRVGVGGWDPLHDASFATDANGLPALPGTSIAGVLRHAAADAWGDAESVQAVFGFQRRDQGRASRLEVSWGQVHGQHDLPVPFLGATLGGDEVLAFLAAGVLRDHVRIGARGAVDGRGKFDELMVPAGARFTFELALHEVPGKTLADLVALLHAPSIRLGAGSRKGLGRFRVVQAAGRSFDLAKTEDRRSMSELPRGLHDAVPQGFLQPVCPPTPQGSVRWRTGTLVLDPQDYWIIGRGDPHRPEHRKGKGDEARYVDTVPVEQRRVVWAEGAGRLEDPEPVVPATAVKGALRHRMAFHARRLRGQFCDEVNPAEGDFTDPDSVPEVREVFGTVKDRTDGLPGRVLLSDGRATGWRWGRLDHVSLDRFTQGPMDHLLFSEAPLYRGRIQLDVAVDVRELGPEARVALRRALDDLLQGRLAIGAGASRGHGYCVGEIAWTDGGLDA